MIRIGIAGTIAAGKTTVSILLKRRGQAVFNSDQYAKTATHAGNVCFDPLIEILGESVIDPSGDIDRKIMADIIFHDEEKRQAVNAVVHPYVIKGLDNFFEHHKEDTVAFAEVPLLFEAGIEDKFDKILVVTCSEPTAIARMKEYRDYTDEEAEARIRSQLSGNIQVSKADIVIHNDGDLKALDHEINLLMKKLREEARNAAAS